MRDFFISKRTLKSHFVGRACAAHDSVHLGVRSSLCSQFWVFDHLSVLSRVSMSFAFCFVTRRQAGTSKAATARKTAAWTNPPGGPPDAAIPSPSRTRNMQQGIQIAMIARRMLYPNIFISLIERQHDP